MTVDEKYSGMEFVPLSVPETRFLLTGVAPTVTVTWFQGNHNKASSFIEARIKDMIRLNPWLQGSFSKQGGVNGISYPSKAEESSLTDSSNGSMFLHLQSPVPNIEYGRPLANHAKMNLSIGHLKDASQPLWKVAIVPCNGSPSTRFVVFVSLSHVAGDGCSFYRLYNMLLCGEEVKPLTIDRISGSYEQCVSIMGYDGANFLSAPKFLIMLVISAIWKVIMGTKIAQRTFLVDEQKMKQLKDEQKGELPYVSTNDIISSWFSVQTKSICTMIPINMRKYLTGPTNDHMGNYLASLNLDLRDRSPEPSFLRERVDSMRNSSLSWRIVPNRTAMISNWSSFPSEHTAVDGCKELLHMPAFDVASVIVPNFFLVFIFRARPGQLGVCATGVPDGVEGPAPFESDQSLF